MSIKFHEFYTDEEVSGSRRAGRQPGRGVVGWIRRRAWIDGLASEQITKSPGLAACRPTRPLVEVQHPPGLLQEPESRGKLHDRYCPGLIGSSDSHRPIVEAEASETPGSITHRCSSE